MANVLEPVAVPALAPVITSVKALPARSVPFTVKVILESFEALVIFTFAPPLNIAVPLLFREPLMVMVDAPDKVAFVEIPFALPAVVVPSRVVKIH